MGVCKDCALKENCAEYKPNKLQCEDYERYQDVLTNEKWLCQLSTEEKATFLAIVQFDGLDITLEKNHIDKWVAWLKEKHDV